MGDLIELLRQSNDEIDHAAAGEIERLQARVEVLEGAIRWALGEGDAFPMIAEPPYYRWRTELRERSRMKYDREKGHSVAATEQEGE